MLSDWKQVSGDVTASVYGATFAMLDSNEDGTNNHVCILEVINMLDATGEECEGGIYYTSASHVNVDSVPWQTARRIIDSVGRWPEHCEDDKLPESVLERVQWCELHAQEVMKFAHWHRRAMTDTEVEEAGTAQQEAHTLRQWYALEPVERGLMAAEYGGYGDGQSLNFVSLRLAMQYHDIPRDALWHPAEYDVLPEGLEDDVIRLYNVDGFARLAGNTQEDGNGAAFIQDECNDEPMPCSMCHAAIWSGWTCLDGGEFYCSDHIEIVTRA